MSHNCDTELTVTNKLHYLNKVNKNVKFKGVATYLHIFSTLILYWQCKPALRVQKGGYWSSLWADIWRNLSMSQNEPWGTAAGNVTTECWRTQGSLMQPRISLETHTRETHTWGNQNYCKTRHRIRTKLYWSLAQTDVVLSSFWHNIWHIIKLYMHTFTSTMYTLYLHWTKI